MQILTATMPHWPVEVIYGLFSSALWLYAETHYSFKGIYSRLKKKEPEIIADVPFRVDPGESIPVLILVKDAHLHPVQLRQVVIRVSGDACQETLRHDFSGLTIDRQFWHTLLHIKRNPHMGRRLTVDVLIHVKQKHRQFAVHNDNYSCSSHRPFTVQLPETPLPCAKDWLLGEFHCHTNYTNDQVEFGAPIAATQAMAEALGLQFFCATDHSYDLDDKLDDYLANDPDLAKWALYHQEIASHNHNGSDVLIVPGEEVSVGNSKNANIHLLLLNHPDFVPGYGDSAEKWFRTTPTQSLQDVLANVNGTSVAAAAHPENVPSLLEKWFVGRGKWQLRDYLHNNLFAMQIWNGSKAGLAEGLARWVELLLRGKRIFITGGSDAHGNFNRFRQIGLPFWTIREHREHIFGSVRTAVFLPGERCVASLIEAMRQGKMLVTDGPFLQITLTNEKAEQAMPGDTLRGTTFALQLKGMSTPEFGHLHKMTVFYGEFGTNREIQLRAYRDFGEMFECDESLEVQRSTDGYVRAELQTHTGKRTFRCFTNPIWFKGPGTKGRKKH